MRVLATRLRQNPKHAPLLDHAAVESLYLSAPLHDIGKVGVADSILLKPGRLTDEEFQDMKKHADFGRDAIKSGESTRHVE